MIFLMLLLGGIAANVHAQEVEVPVDIQYPILTKILSFDRNLKTRSGNEIVIGILYQGQFRTSLNARDRLAEVVSNSAIANIEGLPLTVKSIDISTESDLELALLRENVDILYVMPLRAFDFNSLRMLSQKHQIVTVTSVPSYIEHGLSVSFELKGEKPHIIINLPAAKLEGADFSSRLLKLSRVIQ